MRIGSARLMDSRTTASGAFDLGVQERPGGLGLRANALLNFVRHKPLGAVCGLIIAVIIATAALAPVIDRYDPVATSLRERLHPPSTAHWFGTDNLGRDVYSRIVNGTRSTLYVGFLSVALAVAGATVLGLLSGYLGGTVDLIVQRIVDALMAFPSLILALALVSVLGPSDTTSLVAIAVTIMPGAARVVRGSTLAVKNNSYVEAGRALGAGTPRILTQHILPNIAAPIIVVVSVQLGSAVLVSASLSFLGVGKPEPAPSWGLMLSGQGRQFLELSPWVAIAPGMAISLTVFAFNMFGDALRDVLDPRLRGASAV